MSARTASSIPGYLIFTATSRPSCKRGAVDLQPIDADATAPVPNRGKHLVERPTEFVGDGGAHRRRVDLGA